jgi:hypothetical protein
MTSAARRLRPSLLYPVSVTFESLSRRITVAKRLILVLKARESDDELAAKEFKIIESTVGRRTTGAVVVVVGGVTGELVGFGGGALGAGGALATVVVVGGGLVGVVGVGLEELVGLYSATQSTYVDCDVVGQANPDPHHVCCWMFRVIG